MKLSVVLPASNEAGYIGACLQALFASDPVAGGAEVIVVVNGSRDATLAEAQNAAPRAAAAGWGFQLLDLAEGGKLNALNHGDALVRGEVRAYLDADVIVSPGLMAALTAALLAEPGPAYGTGRPLLAPSVSAVSRAYGRFWMALPFAQSHAPGFGLFAVNAAGRARWGAFPVIISDDTFIRLSFAPQERVEVPHSYSWPLVEGFRALVKVRRRQDRGVTQINALYPELLKNAGHHRPGKAQILRLALRDPLGFAAYAGVSFVIRFGRADDAWARGR